MILLAVLLDGPNQQNSAHLPFLALFLAASLRFCLSSVKKARLIGSCASAPCSAKLSAGLIFSSSSKVSGLKLSCLSKNSAASVTDSVPSTVTNCMLPPSSGGE
jgi:hypothetical protein